MVSYVLHKKTCKSRQVLAARHRSTGDSRICARPARRRRNPISCQIKDDDRASVTLDHSRNQCLFNFYLLL